MEVRASRMEGRGYMRALSIPHVPLRDPQRIGTLRISTDGTPVAMSVRMTLRSAFPKNLDATIIVVISTSLAILGANHFDRSGPDRALLRQIKEMRDTQRHAYETPANCNENIACQKSSAPSNLERYAQR